MCALWVTELYVLHPQLVPRRKKTTYVVDAFGSWNIVDVILMFFFLKGSISCQFRLCRLIHYFLGVWKNLLGQLSLPSKCQPPAEKTKKWDDEYWDVWSENCQWFDPKMTRIFEGTEIFGVHVWLYVRSHWNDAKYGFQNLELLVNVYVWWVTFDQQIINLSLKIEVYFWSNFDKDSWQSGPLHDSAFRG